MSQDRFSRPEFKDFAKALRSANGSGYVDDYKLFSDYLLLALRAGG